MLGQHFSNVTSFTADCKTIMLEFHLVCLISKMAGVTGSGDNLAICPSIIAVPNPNQAYAQTA